jgi:hypothetical protein
VAHKAAWREEKKAPGRANRLDRRPGVGTNITIVCKVKVALSQPHRSAHSNRTLNCRCIYPRTFHILYRCAAFVPKCRICIVAHTCRPVNRYSRGRVKLYNTKDSRPTRWPRAIIKSIYVVGVELEALEGRSPSKNSFFSAQSAVPRGHLAAGWAEQRDTRGGAQSAPGLAKPLHRVSPGIETLTEYIR